MRVGGGDDGRRKLKTRTTTARIKRTRKLRQGLPVIGMCETFGTGMSIWGHDWRKEAVGKQVCRVPGAGRCLTKKRPHDLAEKRRLTLWNMPIIFFKLGRIQQNLPTAAHEGPRYTPHYHCTALSCPKANQNTNSHGRDMII